MTAASFLLALALSADTGKTPDWPQWRGPGRDGKAAVTGITQKFPDGGPKVAWKLDNIGTGYGSPSVVGEKLYILGGEGGKAGAGEFLLCLNVASGKEIWKAKLETANAKFSDGWGGGPRSSPTVDGDHIYVLGATGDLTCLTAKDGKPVWHKNLVKDFGGKIPNWGYSESPLIDGEIVAVTPGGEKAGVVALNKKTGETVWKTEGFGDGAGYSSLFPTVVDGVRQYVSQSMANAFAVEAASGKLLWKKSSIGRKVAVIPSPVIFDDGTAFFTAGYGAGCESYKLGKSDAEPLIKGERTLSNHHGGVIGFGDNIYGHSDAGGWMCYDPRKGGEAKWQDKGVGKGSISYADGHFYCYSENDGTLARIKASPDKWDELDRFKLPKLSNTRPKSGKVWAHPVIAQGKLFLRDYDLLYAFELK
jgi:outer membrane protein assembly factor BamB